MLKWNKAKSKYEELDTSDGVYVRGYRNKIVQFLKDDKLIETYIPLSEVYCKNEICIVCKNIKNTDYIVLYKNKNKYDDILKQANDEDTKYSIEFHLKNGGNIRGHIGER